MRSNNVLGLIFANTNENNLPDLTAYRTMGSVLFGGKYRVIDFQLSNMSNCGINNVGIIAKSNYMSLMDHLGSGAAWDLSRRRSGITVLPPYSGHSFNTIPETIVNLHGYLEDASEEYVLIVPADCIQNFDYQEVFDFHEKNNADATFVYVKKRLSTIASEFRCLLALDDNSKITNISSVPVKEDEYNLTTGALFIKKDLLLTLSKTALSENKLDIVKDIMQSNIGQYNAYGFEAKGYCEFITSMKQYFDINMQLFDRDVRNELFNSNRPIYTKIRDDSPSKYGLESSVKNSLIAQGCIIEGEVTNSIISKGVYIGKNAKVSNCVIMQDSIINDNCELSYIVVDKDVVVNEGQKIQGCESYPMYIAKKSIV